MGSGGALPSAGFLRVSKLPRILARPAPVQGQSVVPFKWHSKNGLSMALIGVNASRSSHYKGLLAVCLPLFRYGKWISINVDIWLGHPWHSSIGIAGRLTTYNLVPVSCAAVQACLSGNLSLLHSLLTAKPPLASPTDMADDAKPLLWVRTLLPTK